MNQRQERLVILVLFFFSLALRIFFIEQKNLWFDEIYSWRITLGSFREITVITAGDIHPPFFYFVLKIWEGLFGTSVLALRSLSALTASLAIFYIYPISRRILSAENSILVIILYSLSPLNIYFSQEARMAALNLLLNAGSVYYFISMLFPRKRESQQIRLKITTFKLFFTNHNYYLYLLFTTLALYTHYFSFFIIASQIIFLLYYYRKNLKQLIPFAAGYIILLFCYIPWISTMFEQVTKGQSWRYRQSVPEVLSQVIKFIKDISLGFYHRYSDHIFVDITAMIVILIAVLCITGLIKYYSSKEIESKNIILIVSLIVLIPLLSAVIISFRQWIEYFRYLSIIIPFILLLIVTGLSYYKSKIFYPVLTLFLIINIFGVYLFYHNDSKNNDYRGVIKTLTANPVQSEIYVYPHYFGWFIDYYRQQNKLNIPSAENYGWEFFMLRDTLSARKPEQFRLIMDYHSMDSTKYDEYLEPILVNYRKTSTTTYKIEPNTVKLFEFEKR
jgi:uncharacterized membrane protein